VRLRVITRLAGYGKSRDPGERRQPGCDRGSWITLARVAPQIVPIELWLETGEILYLGDRDAAELYEALWLAAPHVRGAVIAAREGASRADHYPA
jgi:hypothetical protein